MASQILVTIAASDHAHGVFEFSPESLFVSGTEPEDGYSNVVLNVSTFAPPVLVLTVLLSYKGVLYVTFFLFRRRGISLVAQTIQTDN